MTWSSASLLASPPEGIQLDWGSLIAETGQVITAQQSPTVAGETNPFLIAVGGDSGTMSDPEVTGGGAPYLLTGNWESIRVPRFIYNPYTHTFVETYTWVTWYAFNSAWTALQPPTPLGVLLQRGLPEDFSGKTLSSLVTGNGTTILVCVGADNIPYYNAEATPHDPGSFADAWTQFPDAPQVRAIAAGSTAGTGVVAFLSVSEDDSTSPNVFVSYQQDAADADSWTPLAQTPALPLTGNIVSLDLSATASGVSILAVDLAFGLTEAGTAGPVNTYAFLQGPPPQLVAETGSWLTGSTDYVQVSDEAFSPLCYQFVLSAGIAPVEVYARMANGTLYNVVYDTLPISFVQPPTGFFLALAPPYLFSGVTAPTQYPGNGGPQLGSQDVFLGFTQLAEKQGNVIEQPYLQALTFPLTMRWWQANPPPPALVNAPSPAGYMLTTETDATSLIPAPVATLPLISGEITEFDSITDIACCVFPDGSEWVFVVGGGGAQVAQFRGTGPSTPGIYLEGANNGPYPPTGYPL